MEYYLLELAHCACGDWKVGRTEMVRRALFWDLGARVHVVGWLLPSGLEAVLPVASVEAPVPETEMCKKIEANLVWQHWKSFAYRNNFEHFLIFIMRIIDYRHFSFAGMSKLI